VSVCACGSGLDAGACCSLDVAGLEPARPSDANEARLAALLDAAARHDGKAATDIAIAVLSEQPTLVEALWVLFQIRKSQGQRAAAMALLRRMTALAPQEPSFAVRLVESLVLEGAWDEAEAAARRIVRLVPDDAQAQGVLGLVFSMRERLPEGEMHLRRALALCDGRPPRLLMQLAANRESQGHIGEARAFYEEASGMSAVAPEAQFALARLEWIEGHAGRMAERLERLGDAARRSPAAVTLRARAAYDEGDFDAVLAAFDASREAGRDPSPTDRYLIGQALDRLGRYDEAFAAFERANAGHVDNAGAALDTARFKSMSEAVRGFLTAPTLERLPRASVAPGPQPLFIVGFPRSGTTMLEQSLSMHPRIVAGGELPSLLGVASAAPRLLACPLAYPAALSELWIADQRDQIGLLRDHYLNSAKRSLPGDAAAWFTDKALAHEVHLGLAHLLFPASPIVHIVRHPLDVVVSGYANGLPHGGYRGGIGQVAEFYRLLLETAEHFQANAPSLRYMRVRYEDIVDDQEHWTRAILDFIGEPFDAACLRFHENERRSPTLSRRQVREPLNAKSKFRYRNYIEHLGPAIGVLEPAIDKLGYEI
jgi:tetratricopeptide (TPR) repeat protein